MSKRVIGPPPVFYRGDTPFWLAACGCEASALEWRYCARHGAAPELFAIVQELASDTPIWPLDHLRATARAAIAKAKGV